MVGNAAPPPSPDDDTPPTWWELTKGISVLILVMLALGGFALLYILHSLGMIQ